jgi:hypothetical protein
MGLRFQATARVLVRSVKGGASTTVMGWAQIWRDPARWPLRVSRLKLHGELGVLIAVARLTTSQGLSTSASPSSQEGFRPSLATQFTYTA